MDVVCNGRLNEKRGRLNFGSLKNGLRSWTESRGPGRSEGFCPTPKTILKTYKSQTTPIFILTSCILLYL